MYYETGSIMTMVLGIVFLIIIVGLLISCIKIVPQAQAMVIERLGAYKTTWGVGFHVKVPIIEKVARKVDLKEQVVDFAPHSCILSDYRSKVILLWGGESDHGDRESDRDNPS